MKPLSEQELRERLYTLADLDCDTDQGINACGYDNWYCTYHSSLLNKMYDLILSDRKAWGEQVLDKFRFNNEEHLLCETCWGRSGSRMGGSAMTAWNCKKCGGHHMSGSTAHGTLCDDCAFKSGKCKWCNHNDNMLNEKRNQGEKTDE